MMSSPEERTQNGETAENSDVYNTDPNVNFTASLTALQCYTMASAAPSQLKSQVAEQPSVIGQADDDDRTALIYAVIHGDLPALKNLVELGWSVNQQDREGKTPLAIACYQGWYEGVVYLLSNGANLMICDNKQRLPIHAATYNSKIRCLALLVQHLQPSALNVADREMMTALHWAAFHDRPEHVQLLISKNVQMISCDVDGKTPLHWAAQKGSDRCVEILIRESRGSHLVNMKDNSGKAALHYAAAAGHYDTINYLGSARNINIHLEDPDDRQPLHWAAAMGRPSCVDLLLKLGADPNMHDLQAKNPLHYAKQSSHTECVTLLTDAIRELQLAKRNKLRELDRTLNGYHKSSSSEIQRVKHKKAEKAVESSNNSDGLSSPAKSSSSQLNSTSSSNKSTPTKKAGQPKHRLPPIRGSLTHNKVQALYHEEDDIESQIAEVTDISEEKPTHAHPLKEERASNKAMQFVPTTTLYSDDR